MTSFNDQNHHQHDPMMTSQRSPCPAYSAVNQSPECIRSEVPTETTALGHPGRSLHHPPATGARARLSNSRALNPGGHLTSLTARPHTVTSLCCRISPASEVSRLPPPPPGVLSGPVQGNNGTRGSAGFSKAHSLLEPGGSVGFSRAGSLLAFLQNPEQLQAVPMTTTRRKGNVDGTNGTVQNIGEHC
jgi:hypothetical protein